MSKPHLTVSDEDGNVIGEMTIPERAFGGFFGGAGRIMDPSASIWRARSAKVIRGSEHNIETGWQKTMTMLNNNFTKMISDVKAK